MRICSIPDCGKLWFCRDWCSAHYTRWQRHGDPLALSPRPIHEYLENVLKFNAEDCLAWPYTRTSSGYGQITIEGRRHNVSRYVCMVVQGPPPTPEHIAAHNCGKGHLGCVNPKHIAWKTPSENQNDRNTHGTDMRGEQHHQAKLTEQKIRKIRDLAHTHTNAAIAKMFGVSFGQVGRIVSRKAWAHV